MGKNRATQDELDALHKELASTLTKMVRTVKRAADDGEELKGAAATLNVARQFLKDNGVDGVPAPESPLNNLLTELPFDHEVASTH